MLKKSLKLKILLGLNDPRVPAGESEQIVREVRKHGVDVWYMLAKDEGHGFSKKKNIVIFFFNLKILIL
jgi:dipeptidyl aminopeptidase/acylaminoacyl peptidase